LSRIGRGGLRGLLRLGGKDQRQRQRAAASHVGKPEWSRH
jgi:hypothetical protein